jgi:uncharacterized protein (TIRG00374 family)
MRMNPDRSVDNRPIEFRAMKTASSWKSARRWVWIAVMLGITLLVSSRFTDARDLIRTLSTGLWPWIALGVAIHIAYFCLYAFLYQAGFKTVGIQARAVRLIPVVAASVFANAVAPIGGMGGGALFLSYLVSRGQSAARGTIGLILVVLADLVTLIPFIIFSLVYLGRQGALAFYDILAGGLFATFVLILMGMVAAAGWRISYVQRVLKWLHGGVNWAASHFGKAGILGSDWVEGTANDLAESSRAIASHPRQLAITVTWGFVVHLVNLVGLYAFFLAFRQPITLSGLVASFSLGIVFFVVAIIPQGVGAVEGIMSLVLTSLGVPSTKAITIVLAFRGVNFWLPMAVGLFVFPYVTGPQKED